MTREAAVVQSLVLLADTIVDDFDVVELLSALADRCVEVLDVSAAGVMLASPDGGLRLVASSSEAMRVVELYELQAQEGPCLDAFHTGQRVEHEDLQEIPGPWPRFSAVARDAGFRSAFALPLRLRNATIGALNVFSTGATPMAESDVVVLRGFADMAAIAILQQRAATEAQRINEQLTHALESRVVIEQAKGVVFERAGVEMPVAFSLLREYARSHNLRLTEVAQAVIDGAIDTTAWGATSGG